MLKLRRLASIYNKIRTIEKQKKHNSSSIALLLLLTFQPFNFLNKLLAVLGFIETGENEDNGSCQ